MSLPLHVVSTLRAAGDTNPGLQRDVNEDRFHVDLTRGLFIVIDGVGGQAAGGKAADTAISMMRARLERETGPVATRLREAITVANNEIHRLSRLRTEWSGMACVLTAVVVGRGRAIVGHVGDTRLYKIRNGRIEKITLDHSPVGEREDARELSELDAMQHPRRNEVYRDVGSEPHGPADADFIDIQEIAFEPDAALLLCTDGLTDLVDSASINATVRRLAGRPREVVHALIAAANDAGGKDNVTVVYVEGERFPPAVVDDSTSATEITRRLKPASSTLNRRGAVRLANILLIAIVIVLTLVSSDSVSPRAVAPPSATPEADPRRIVVRPTESISDAVDRAPAGATIVVEPGQYRETVTLKSFVRVVSSVPRGAVIRLPGASPEASAAVFAGGVTAAALEGFRIVGDAATPLGTGVLALDADITLSDVEITGAADAAIDAGRGSRVHVVGADLRDNPGAAVVVRSGGTASISHSVFTRNATAGRGLRALDVENTGQVRFTANVFLGSTPNGLTGSADLRGALTRDNWFLENGTVAAPRTGRRSR